MATANPVYFRSYEELDSHVHNSECLWVKPSWAQPSLSHLIEQYDLLRSRCGQLSDVTVLIKIILAYICEEIICVHIGMWLDCYNDEAELWYPNRVQQFNLVKEHNKDQIYVKMFHQYDSVLLDNSLRIAPFNKYTQPSVSLIDWVSIKQLKNLHQVPLYIDYRITALSSQQSDSIPKIASISSFRYWVPARVLRWSFGEEVYDCSCKTFHCSHRLAAIAEQAQGMEIQVIFVECHSVHSGQLITTKIYDECDLLWRVAPYKTWSTSETYQKCREFPSIVELDLEGSGSDRKV